jgi:hypothetical protein
MGPPLCSALFCSFGIGIKRNSKRHCQCKCKTGPMIPPLVLVLSSRTLDTCSCPLSSLHFISFSFSFFISVQFIQWTALEDVL